MTSYDDNATDYGSVSQADQRRAAQGASRGVGVSLTAPELFVTMLVCFVAGILAAFMAGIEQ